jgi:uncharacterized DUF497 family protein
MKLAGVEWDEEKNEANKLKHNGLSFELAQYVFSDPERLDRPDQSEGNTSGEARLQTLGVVDKVLFVVFAEHGEKKRIITARLATRAERRNYNGYYLIDGKGWSKTT